MPKTTGTTGLGHTPPDPALLKPWGCRHQTRHLPSCNARPRQFLGKLRHGPRYFSPPSLASRASAPRQPPTSPPREALSPEVCTHLRLLNQDRPRERNGEGHRDRERGARVTGSGGDPDSPRPRPRSPGPESGAAAGPATVGTSQSPFDTLSSPDNEVSIRRGTEKLGTKSAPAAAASSQSPPGPVQLHPASRELAPPPPPPLLQCRPASPGPPPAAGRGPAWGPPRAPAAATPPRQAARLLDVASEVHHVGQRLLLAGLVLCPPPALLLLPPGPLLLGAGWGGVEQVRGRQDGALGRRWWPVEGEGRRAFCPRGCEELYRSNE